MNKIKIYGIIVLLFAVSNIFALVPPPTIYPPANPDESDPVFPEYKVVNTGNDMITYDFYGNPYKMKITVADGDEPHIIFKEEDGYGNGVVGTNIIDNSLCPNDEIIDPDVVLVQNFTTHYSMNIDDVETMIVYETLNHEINLIIKKYDRANNTWILSQSINLGNGENPNIDISTAIDPVHIPLPPILPHQDTDAKFVIVWEDNGNIKSIAGSCDYYGNYTFGQTTTIYNKITDASVPDVTISFLDTNTQALQQPGHDDTWTVTYTFLNKKNNELLVHQEKFDDVFNGNINSNNLVVRHSFNSTDIMDVPRIASPDNDHGLAPYQFDDYTIVMGAVIDPSSTTVHHSILGFNNHFGVASTPYHYEHNTTTGIYEGKPVVAYAGDIIIVAWEIDAWGGNPFGLVGRDIIQHQLTYNGSFATTYYSRVNMDVTETQAIPSVAADYSYDVLYSFYDENDLNIRFKSSHCINQNLRIKKPDPILGIYPNPATDILNISIEENAVFKLFDINGRLVKEQYLIAGNTSLDISKLSKGMYIAKLEYTFEVKTKRIIIY